jgi:hypothetical protein
MFLVLCILYLQRNQQCATVFCFKSVILFEIEANFIQIKSKSYNSCASHLQGTLQFTTSFADYKLQITDYSATLGCDVSRIKTL